MKPPRPLLPVLAALLLAACGRDPAPGRTAPGVLVQGAQGDAGPATADQEAAALDLARDTAEKVEPIQVDYPLDESVFPPDFVPPTLIWKDATAGVDRWLVRVDVPGSDDLLVLVPGAPPPMGEIDETVIAPTNELPERPAPGMFRSWRPDDVTWARLKKATHEAWATVEITGFGATAPTKALSRGRFTFKTSKDPVGAPIFYRDVPLAPAKTEKGVIMPLAVKAFNLIRWRLRDVGLPESRVVLEDMPTCANCHSFSQDGSTFGMDIDGPQGDKGTYAVVPISERIEIDYDDIVSWNDFPGKDEGLNTFGFLLAGCRPTGGMRSRP